MQSCAQANPYDRAPYRRAVVYSIGQRPNVVGGGRRLLVQGGGRHVLVVFVSQKSLHVLWWQQRGDMDHEQITVPVSVPNVRLSVQHGAARGG